MSRKQIFANLSNNPAENAEGAAERPRQRVRPILGAALSNSDNPHSPVGMLGQSLNEANERSKRAEEIEKKLAEGLSIVSLNPDDIDPSFIPDRMPSTAADDAGLVEAIREQGQQVPILVRPHPEQPGKYQVAFGHRRLRAVKEIGIPVKAVVRDLTDEQLVVAQGQENNERRDLSYIEKARFAQKLQQRFPRHVIMAAMSIYKGDLSNMLSVVGRIPDDIIDSIGSAPSIGRRNWMELADNLSTTRMIELARGYFEDEDLRHVPSDERFKRLLDYLKPKPEEKQATILTSRSGTRLAKISQSDKRLDLSIDRKAAPEFAEFVLNHLQDLYEDFRSKQ